MLNLYPQILFFISVFIFIMWANIYENFVLVNEESLLEKFLRVFNIKKSISIMFLNDKVEAVNIIKKTNTNLNLQKNLHFCQVIKNTFIKETNAIYHIDDFVKCCYKHYLNGWKKMQLPSETKYFSQRTLNKLFFHFSRIMGNNKYILIAPTNWFIKNNFINKIDFNIFITNYELAYKMIRKYSNLKIDSNKIDTLETCETICEIIPLIKSDNGIIISSPCTKCKLEWYDLNELWLGMNINQINRILQNNQTEQE